MGEILSPPPRPSKQAIELYRKGIEKIKPSHIVILGSTPELRDLAAEYDCKVTVIDINKEFNEAMNSILKKKNPKEETIIQDWIEISLLENSVDVVLSDIALENVMAINHPLFLENLVRILKKDGLWISKMEVIPNDWQFLDFDQVLDYYAHVPMQETVFWELICHLLSDAWDKKDKVEMKKIKEWMEKHKVEEGKYIHSNKRITQFLNDIWEFWDPMDKEWSFGYEKDVDEKVSKYFDIKEKHILKDCVNPKIDETFPIWFCKPKK
ncbi:class I SAM-dependent methyltransferase [Candidatus Woesearchaeota archaeon]|nr:class I SAM-dependent methyltransferase [Candidatus Woesearchaeota archaeon]